MPSEPMDSSIRYPGSDWDAVDAAAKGHSRQAGFLLVLGTQASLPSERKLAAFAEALRLDVFTARQWLLAPTPRVIRRESRHERVLEWTAWFRAVGVRSFDLPEQLLAEEQILMPVAVHGNGDEFRFELEDGSQRTIPYSDFFCGVFGEVRDRLSTEVTSPTIAGEIVASRQTALHSEMVMDLHRRDVPQVIRIGQDTLHWSAMYPDETGQSAMLMKRLKQRMRKELAGIPFFEDFGRAEPILGTSSELIKSSTYLETRWLGAGGRNRLRRQSQQLESSRRTFTIYSTLHRWELLRIGLAR